MVFSDRFQNADHVADFAVFIFNAHIDDTAVIRDPVKRRVDFNTPFSEFFSDIVWKYDVSPAAFPVCIYRRGKAVYFFVFQILLFLEFYGRGRRPRSPLLFLYIFNYLLNHNNFFKFLLANY